MKSNEFFSNNEIFWSIQRFETFNRKSKKSQTSNEDEMTLRSELKIHFSALNKMRWASMRKHKNPYYIVQNADYSFFPTSFIAIILTKLPFNISNSTCCCCVVSSESVVGEPFGFNIIFFCLRTCLSAITVDIVVVGFCVLDSKSLKYRLHGSQRDSLVGKHMGP